MSYVEHVLCRAEDSIAGHFTEKGDIGYYLLLRILDNWNYYKNLQHRINQNENQRSEKEIKKINRYEIPKTNDQLLIELIARNRLKITSSIQK